ncbi:MAG: TCR/Tet family MFS transporter [Hyphomicrobiales bacterium]
MKNQRGKASLAFIFITILIDVIGLGIIIPVLPGLIESLTGEGLSDASKWGGLLLFAHALAQFFFAPLLGELSDRFGRRPVILIALFGLGIDYMFCAWAPTIFFLFIGRLISGVTGASYTVAAAYIADISTAENKAKNFGMIGVAFGLGFILGPVIGGLVSDFGVRAPFIVAGCLSFVNFLYGYFILPESLVKEKRRKVNLKKANPFSAVFDFRNNKLVFTLLASFLVVYVASYAIQSTWSFFTMFRFDWTPKDVGYSLGFVGLLVAIVQGGLVQLFVNKFGYKNCVFIGLSLWALGLILFSFATKGWMMYAILIPYSLGNVANPAIQGIMSNAVGEKEQGKLQGVVTSIMSFTAIIGPLLMTALFAAGSSGDLGIFFPGAAFMCAAILVIISILIALRIRKYD